MAPIDRREHRQQRVRGAGTSSVQASFGFNIGALGARPAKQASLPPQLTSRRTPVRSTPRGANGSAQRHRSASVQRSGSAKPRATPKDATVTPHLGKTRRGPSKAGPNVDDGDVDELSPEHAEPVRSIEKSRRVAATVSPIREEIDDEPDELSILGDGGSTARKSATPTSAAVNGTPVSVLAQKRAPNGANSVQKPIMGSATSVESLSRRIARRSVSQSIEPVPTTPGMLTAGQPRLSSTSRVTTARDTPNAIPAADESEDELSPEHATFAATPSIVAIEKDVDATQAGADDMEVDELSSPMQPTPSTQRANVPSAARRAKSPPAVQPAKTRRPRPVVRDKEDEASSALPAQEFSKQGQPARSAPTKTAATPATSKQKTKTAHITNPDEYDELSPDKDRDVQVQRQTKKRSIDAVVLSDGEESDEYEELEEPEEEDPVPTPPRSTNKRASPKRTQHIRQTSEKPPRKRQRFLGPKQAISVMRIKGSTVRGITVADTTRTILEETIDHRVSRLNEAAQSSNDSARRKELRGTLNMFLAFKESLNEKLLDLQDANDILSTNFQKLKLFKRDNAELRKDILALQNSKQEVAIEHDDVQADYDAQKAAADARNKLSEDMFGIEAAVQAGRDKARREGREDEGPHVPLGMLIGMVGRDVGSAGGGLLGNIKVFNSALEKAAGWLEGRA